MKKTNQGKANFLTLQETRLKLIEDCFNQLVYQLASKGSQSETECPPEQPREWPKLSLLQSIKQPLTQDQMKCACESIRNNAVSELDAVQKHKYTVIDFAKGSQVWDEQTFSLGNMVLGVEILGGTQEDFDFPQDTRLDATVYIRSENRMTQAFLKAKESDGKEHFYELEKFSMLYGLCDNDGQEPGVEGEKVTGDIGMFTTFNRTNNLMFIATY